MDLILSYLRIVFTVFLLILVVVVVVFFGAILPMWSITQFAGYYNMGEFETTLYGFLFYILIYVPILLGIFNTVFKNKTVWKFIKKSNSRNNL